MSCSTSADSRILPVVVDCTIIQPSLSYGILTQYFRSRTRPMKTFWVRGPARGELRTTRAGSDQDSQATKTPRLRRLPGYEAWPKSDVRLIRGEIRTNG